jgi:hypothetical protein
MAYDFSTIDSNDFELLARDILNAQFSLDLQSFKSGKDKGIDLRYSSPSNSNEIVVQAKHWLRSGYQKLYREIEKEELSKIQDLKPGRYILVTSVSIGAVEKDQLVNLLSPYVQSANDILGEEDLTKYLSGLKDIEQKWYKLWLTSVPVMQRVLHNGIIGVNEFAKEKVKKTIQRYVHCSSYDIAFDILKEHKYLLITGQPGVGKTTLAYYLTYNLLADGFQLLYVDSDLSQASTLLSNDPEEKQVIFFDDFLGETYLEVNNPKTTESAFVFFLERIMSSENKYLILTTRTTIYTNARDKYEKMERMRVDTGRRHIELDQYNLLDKARILQKHIYFSEIPDEFKDMFFVHKNYWTIIEHRCYNPRLIEFITSRIHIPKTVDAATYWKFVQNTLEHPQEVWKYFYLNQLSVEERLLLHVVFTQGRSATTEDSKALFLHMLEYEIKHYQHRPVINPFQSSAKRLLDGTVKKEIHVSDVKGRFSFINPSLSDFLKHFFQNSEEERRKLLAGACSVEQFEQYSSYFFSFENEVECPEGDAVLFAELLIDRAASLICYQQLKREKNRTQYIQLRIASMLSKLVYTDATVKVKVTKFILEAVRHYPINELNAESLEFYVGSIQTISKYTELYEYVLANWVDIINELFKSCTVQTEFEEVRELFDLMGQDYNSYLIDHASNSILEDALNDLANSLTEEWLTADRYKIQSETDWDDVKETIRRKRSKLFNTFELEDDWYDESEYFDEDEMDEIIKKNVSRSKAVSSAIFLNKQKNDINNDENLVKEIELLFTGEYDLDFVRNKADDLFLPF